MDRHAECRRLFIRALFYFLAVTLAYLCIDADSAGRKEMKAAPSSAEEPFRAEGAEPHEGAVESELPGYTLEQDAGETMDIDRSSFLDHSRSSSGRFKKRSGAALFLLSCLAAAVWIYQAKVQV
ncbi:hypothetical protein Emed_007614 [Eimeria media]